MSSDPATEPADRVAEAVLGVPGVHGLHAGVLGEAATYLPGRRVNGVKVTGDSCEVHVVLDGASPLLATADAVRSAVESLVDGPVHVIVEDISTISDTPTPGTTTTPTTHDPQTPETKEPQL